MSRFTYFNNRIRYKIHASRTQIILTVFELCISLSETGTRLPLMWQKGNSIKSVWVEICLIKILDGRLHSVLWNSTSLKLLLHHLLAAYKRCLLIRKDCLSLSYTHRPHTVYPSLQQLVSALFLNKFYNNKNIWMLVLHKEYFCENTILIIIPDFNFGRFQWFFALFLFCFGESKNKNYLLLQT